MDEGRLIAETNDVRQFGRLVPELARRERIRLFEMQPVDESLASVFSYLVGT
jgi:ABC-2 type transport system ATP-binding protein